MNKKVAVVSGGNRGIGFGVVEAFAKLGYSVVMGCRDLSQSESILSMMQGKLEVTALELDVKSTVSVLKFRDDTLERYGQIDVLINNGAIYLEEQANFLEIDELTLQETLDVNVVGVWRMCKTISPGMIKQGYGRIVNISSGWGGISEVAGNAAAYRLSKSALNALTRIISSEMAGKGDIRVNAVCPGWVRTRMGMIGGNAPTSVCEAAEAIVWAATHPDAQSGEFYRNKIMIPW